MDKPLWFILISCLLFLNRIFLPCHFVGKYSLKIQLMVSYSIESIRQCFTFKETGLSFFKKLAVQVTKYVEKHYE